jgi:hypothetical protein
MRNLAFFFFLLAGAVMAPYGGETALVMNVPQCDKLTVQVTGSLPIDSGEYELINCTKTAANDWECTCHDNYKLYMKTKVNTVNDYDFVSTVYIEPPVTDSDGDGVMDDKDLCPNSINKKVDQQGCTSDQFCGRYQIVPRKPQTYLGCYLQDWKSNERAFFPADCVVYKYSCIATRIAN